MRYPLGKHPNSLANLTFNSLHAKERQRAVARTVPKQPQGRRSRGLYRLTATFDDDQAEEVLAFARAQNVTVTEAIRLLCEWGLESTEK